jgi:hypothetical protein
MKQETSGKNNLSWRKAVIEVLKASDKPMSSAEIVAAIKERQLREVTGNTPEATIGALIYTSMQEDGENSPFIQKAPNEFAFNQTSKFTSAMPQPNAEITSEDNEEKPKKITGIIRAFGMYWRRDYVVWKTTPRIIGFRSGKKMDFCNQRAIYLLHDGSQLVYVGRALDRPLGTRLLEHSNGRLNGRWDRFSWFGLLNLSEDGKLLDEGLKNFTANGNDIIVTMEALLIEALEPKQNRRGGDTFKGIEYTQMEDPEIEEKRNKVALFTKLIASGGNPNK